MANKHRGELEIIIEDTPYVLQLKQKHHEELKAKLSIESLQDLLEKFNDPKNLASILLIALKEKHPDMSLEKISEMFFVRDAIKRSLVEVYSLSANGPEKTAKFMDIIDGKLDEAEVKKN